MTLKIHLYDIESESGMPIDIWQEYFREGKSGTACGYMRKVTTDPKKVTCFFCKKIMEKRRCRKNLNTKTKK